MNFVYYCGKSILCYIVGAGPRMCGDIHIDIQVHFKYEPVAHMWSTSDLQMTECTGVVCTPI